MLQKDLDTLWAWTVENGIKINAGKAKQLDLREIGLKFHWLTPFAHKMFRKLGVLNNWE